MNQYYLPRLVDLPICLSVGLIERIQINFFVEFMEVIGLGVRNNHV